MLITREKDFRFREVALHDSQNPKGSGREKKRQIGDSEKQPHIKTAARAAAGVSTVRGGRRFCNFDGRQQLAEGAPVSGMPILRSKSQGRDSLLHARQGQLRVTRLLDLQRMPCHVAVKLQ
jgi:hypothetical protein